MLRVTGCRRSRSAVYPRKAHMLKQEWFYEESGPRSGYLRGVESTDVIT